MIQAPASQTVVGSPQWLASKGQRIIQCGPIGMARLVLSRAFVLLCFVHERRSSSLFREPAEREPTGRFTRGREPAAQR